MWATCPGTRQSPHLVNIYLHVHPTQRLYKGFSCSSDRCGPRQGASCLWTQISRTASRRPRRSPSSRGEPPTPSATKTTACFGNPRMGFACIPTGRWVWHPLGWLAGIRMAAYGVPRSCVPGSSRVALIHWEDGVTVKSNFSYLYFYYYLMLQSSWWWKGLVTLLWVGG